MKFTDLVVSGSGNTNFLGSSTTLTYDTPTNKMKVTFYYANLPEILGKTFKFNLDITNPVSGKTQ